MFFGNIDVRWRVWWSAVEVGLAAFLSAITSRDNCLRARSGALKRPVFAGFSLKAPDCR